MEKIILLYITVQKRTRCKSPARQNVMEEFEILSRLAAIVVIFVVVIFLSKENNRLAKYIETYGHENGGKQKTGSGCSIRYFR